MEISFIHHDQDTDNLVDFITQGRGKLSDITYIETKEAPNSGMQLLGQASEQTSSEEDRPSLVDRNRHQLLRESLSSEDDQIQWRSVTLVNNHNVYQIKARESSKVPKIVFAKAKGYKGKKTQKSRLRIRDCIVAGPQLKLRSERFPWDKKRLECCKFEGAIDEENDYICRSGKEF